MSAPIRIPEGFVDELKARIRPSEVIGRKVKLKKAGQGMGRPVALHQRKNAKLLCQ